MVSHSFFLAATINKEASQSTKEHLLCKKEKEIRKHIYIYLFIVTRRNTKQIKQKQQIWLLIRCEGGEQGRMDTRESDTSLRIPFGIV